MNKFVGVLDKYDIVHVLQVRNTNIKKISDLKVYCNLKHDKVINTESMLVSVMQLNLNRLSNIRCLC